MAFRAQNCGSDVQWCPLGRNRRRREAGAEAVLAGVAPPGAGPRQRRRCRILRREAQACPSGVRRGELAARLL